MVATTWYFAYGSNMSRSQMKRKIGRWKACFPAVLDGYRIFFGHVRKTGRHGFATIMPSGKSRICGAVYRLSARQMKLLDIEATSARREGGAHRISPAAPERAGPIHRRPESGRITDTRPVLI